MPDPMIRAPEGMRDRLFDECTLRRGREAAFASLFRERGFREVSTPVLEHYGLFTRTGSPLPEETMVKVIDHTGRICVLRPDNTAPIARLAASRLLNEPLPIRLWYAQPVYRAGIEMLQTGVEAIGVTDDAEVIRLACEATALFFNKTPHIEVSHAGLLETIYDALSLDSDVREQFNAYLERKNFASLGDDLTTYMKNPAARDLLTLTRLSGGANALDEAERTIKTPLTKPLQALKKLLADLPEGSVSVDFGLAPSIGYYTGVFFRGYVEGAPGAVLTGGRYDRLLGLLGREAPAIGFAIETE